MQQQTRLSKLMYLSWEILKKKKVTHVNTIKVHHSLKQVGAKPKEEKQPMSDDLPF